MSDETIGRVTFGPAIPPGMGGIARAVLPAQEVPPNSHSDGIVRYVELDWSNPINDHLRGNKSYSVAPEPENNFEYVVIALDEERVRVYEVFSQLSDALTRKRTLEEAFGARSVALASRKIDSN